MFERDNAEINLLLTGLLIVSACIGGLHHWSLGAAEKADTAKVVANPSESKKEADSLAVEGNPLADSSPDEIFDALQPLIISNSVEKTIKMLIGIPLPTALSVLKKILDIKEGNLDRDDRIQIIVGIAARYKKLEEQYAVLDLIIDPHYLYLREGTPILVIAAYGDFPEVIPVIKTWYANRVAKQVNHAELCEELEARALSYAVENNKLDELKAMVTNGLSLSGNRMSEFLVDAIKRKTECKIIQFLLENGADINYVDKGYTPLLWAIKNNDLKAVKFLVNKGADVNKIGDNKIGNPRQLANQAIEDAAKAVSKGGKKNKIRAKNHAIAIEAYLIEHGADN